MKKWIILVPLGIALSATGASGAFAQAGSTGGTIGKTDKSISGAGEEQAPAPRRNSTSARAAPVEKNSRCNVVGTWSASWQGIGAGSAEWIIKSDGSAWASNGYQGTWTCTDGAFVATFITGSVLIASPYRRTAGPCQALRTLAPQFRPFEDDNLAMTQFVSATNVSSRSNRD